MKPIVSLAALALVSVPVCLPAQQSVSSATKSASKSVSSEPPAPSANAIHQLPVRQVVLYKNGIGYFEHLGSVSGNQRVAIDFTSSQLNDVLQSLTILDDNGGRIGGVNYNSTTPLSEQLKSLSLAMSDNPSSTELFQALRGQRVEVTGGPGGPLTGHLLSIETRTEKSTTSDTTIDKTYLTLITSPGAVRVLELTPTLSVRPLDANLQGQLDRYLELLSSTHTTGLRHLTLDAIGQGPRQLHVSYISEVPVWKSTYRIVFPKDSTEKAILQGWAVVDNTIGSDWDNVQLSLVAGAPQSFIQPLSQPLYLRRPEIPISTTAMTAPQTHEAADMPEPAAPPLPMPQMAMSAAAGSLSRKLTKTSPTAEGSGGGSGRGLGPGTGSNVGGGIYRTTDALESKDVATSKFDDFFQYTLAQPVTIHKNESAMVPILQENLPAERVTLWSQAESTPFRAIWLENTSKLTFDRGSFSIFEGGVFAGQGLLDPIHPGEKRLLSYAADQAVHVREHPEESKRELRKIHIARGCVRLTYGAESKNTYIASNSAEEARVVVIEVPRQPNRDLSPETKAAETSLSLYRFRLAVAPHQSASVLVADEGPEYEDWTIQEELDETNLLQKLVDAAPAIADKLKPIIAAQQSIKEMKDKLTELEQRRTALTSDEARARENLTALKGNDVAKRFVDELNRTEDELESIRKQTADLTEKKKATVDSLRQSLSTMAIDWNASSK